MQYNTYHSRFPETSLYLAFALTLPLSDKAFRILAAILMLANEQGICVSTLEDIGKLAVRTNGKAMLKPSVYTSVLELHEHELLEFISKRPLKLMVHIPDIEESLENAVPGDDNYPESEPVLMDHELMDHERNVLILAKSAGVLKPGSKDHATDLFALRSNVFNKDISINKTTTTKDSSLPPTDPAELEKLNFPNAPVTVQFCEQYFLGYFEINNLNQDARSAALDFMDHWENKKGWMYKRKGDTFPTLITADRVKRHLSTWAGNIKKGIYQYEPKRPKDDSNGVKKGPWMYWGQMNDHAKRLRLTTGDTKFYEFNGEKDDKARWRYVEQSTNIHIDGTI